MVTAPSLCFALPWWVRLLGYVCYKNESEFEDEGDEQLSSMRRGETESKGIEIAKKMESNDNTGFDWDDE